MGLGNRKVKNMSKLAKRGIWLLLGILISGIGGFFLIKNSEFMAGGELFAEFMTKALTIFLFYLAISILLKGKVVQQWYLLIEILQNFYIETGDTIGKKLVEKTTVQIRKILRTCCFMLMFLLMVVMDVKSRNQFRAESRFWVVLFGVLIFVVGILSWEKPLQKRDWKNSFVAIWTILWMIACVSDLLVRKSFSFTGYVMFLCVGFTIFVWQNTGEMRKIYRVILCGLEWTFPIVIVYCLCFRMKKPGVLYSGCFTNRESMALYSLTLFLAFLTNFNEIFKTKKTEIVKLIASGIGLSFSCYYLYYTKVFGCLLAALAIVIIWLVFQIRHIKSIVEKGGKLILILGISILLSLGLIIIVNAGSKILPQRIGISVNYAKEVEEPDTKIETEWAEKKSVWKEYIREWNLVGNKDALRKSGKTIDACNGFLQMMNRYGIVILIPYSLILIFCVWKIRKEREFAIFATVVGFLIAMIFQNVEIPFTNALWLLFYLIIGNFFENNLEI